MKFSPFTIMACATLLSACQRKEIEKPNILMIAIDDMKNWVGAWKGLAMTPNIDKLASEGVQFTNAYCAVPACNPSRPALMTGQRPETTGQYTNAGNFRERPGGMERITIPQFLAQYGYTTTAAGKLFHHNRGLGKDPKPLSDPISWQEQWVGNVGTGGHQDYLINNRWAKWHNGEIKKYIADTMGNDGLNYIGKFGVWGPIDDSKEECADWQMTEFCADFLSKEHDKPFMLACGIFRPHSPQLAPKEYFDMYPLEDIVLPELPNDDMDDIPEIAKENWSSPFVELVKEKHQLKNAIQGYLACMTFADDCVGNLLNALENSRYKDNTIIVFWTDHGWQLGHKNRWEKFSLWKQATNSPMIIKVPGKYSGTVVDQAVSFIDIYPTIAELAGLDKPDYLEGVSLLPLMKNPSHEREIPAIITYPGNNHSIVYKNWNYIHYEDGSEELYDHSKDPEEFTNLITNEDYIDIVQKLKSFIPK